MPPTADEKRAALQEVLGTATFVRAGQLQAFLRLICEMEIAGRANDINEYLIGVEVLGRPAGYSPAQDSVVRRRAVDLREKLEEVYAGELAGAPLRVELPKGRYVPRFMPRAAAADSPLAPPAGPSRSRRWPMLTGFAAGLVTGIALAAGAFVLIEHRGAARDEGTVYEAEAAGNVLSGTAVVEPCESCSGSRRVRRIGHLPASFVAVRGVRAPSAGTYTIVLHYLLSGERAFFVSVNDGPGLEVPLSGTSWTTPARASVPLPLRAGENTIRLYNDADYAPDLDRIVVRPSPER